MEKVGFSHNIAARAKCPSHEAFAGLPWVCGVDGGWRGGHLGGSVALLVPAPEPQGHHSNSTDGNYYTVG